MEQNELAAKAGSRPAMKYRTWRHLALTAAVVVAIVALDQVSKCMVLKHIPGSVRVTVLPGVLDLTNVQNPGAAFGLLSETDFAGKKAVLSAITVLAVCAVIYLLFNSEPKSRLLMTGLILIMSGALGNLYDRVFRHGVVDFIEVYYGSFRWPAFNVADSAITVGVVLMILDFFVSKPQAAASATEEGK